MTERDAVRPVKTNHAKPSVIVILVSFLLAFVGALFGFSQESPVDTGLKLSEIPEFSGTPYYVVNQNQPSFSKQDYVSYSFETYGELDELGRCTAVMASVGRDLMPNTSRENISHVRPSGWKTVQYEFVDGKSLYNRCHLIGFQLSGENANEKNLITGTRFMNVDGMLPFENMVADYVKETGNHVLYRVTPIFQSTELVARGVQLEGWSVEDAGLGICLNVFVYNNQPGVVINYATGDSKLIKGYCYVLNLSTHKFHEADCTSVPKIQNANKELYFDDRDELLRKGFSPCSACKP